MLKKKFIHQSEELILIDNVFGTLPIRLAMLKNMEKVNSPDYRERTIWHSDVTFNLGPIRTTNNVMLMGILNGILTAFLENQFAAGQNTFTIGYPFDNDPPILIKCKKIERKGAEALRLSVFEKNAKGDHEEHYYGILDSFLIPGFQDMFRKALHWATPGASFYTFEKYDLAELNKRLEELKPKKSFFNALQQ